ncbi:SDR family NAD(P)-dependent oxidoreductase [Nitriliruptor alkaliphilus]|uniref:SDR family NAD(P)-dependent oxidoreductase n=1 Tax=Nitriliruptor alkaliphilus TaxID=427918 RepID=UPI0006970B61|nr:SDR family oxidoreductase [Nitriliruptor alkaliphilus]
MNDVPAVIVTGAAGALGAATVSAFRAAGFAVAGLDRDPVVTHLAGDGCRGIRVELTDAGEVEEVLDELRGSGRLHHLVGIAGGALPEEPLTQHDPVLLSPEVFQRSLEANLTSQYIALRAALGWFRDADPAPDGADRSITLISSWNALTSQGMPAYSAAKAGLIGMMHALVRPLGAEGIRVNVVAPGTIRTPRTERIWEHDEGRFERLAATTATGRLGVPEDVARTCLALATQLTHVTGQVLVVDGGQGG